MHCKDKHGCEVVKGDTVKINGEGLIAKVVGFEPGQMIVRPIKACARYAVETFRVVFNTGRNEGIEIIHAVRR